jgi:alkanesulfonate monooxygenase SsuD/methylene tetrahydromethanopterin reductase-like flavin-dependent oxidoreductase (luciferase family)
VTRALLGVTLPQFTNDPDKLLDGVRRAEACGLDSVWLFDHLWPLTGGKSRSIFECWTALAYLASHTDRIIIGTLVTRSSLRHPALLGKMAATVNEIAPDRFILAIGSGDAASKDENESFGLPYYSGRRRIGQLASTVEVVTKYLAGEAFDHEDDFTTVRGLAPSPHRSPAPPVWVGGQGPSALELAGRLGNGWNGWGGTPQQFAQRGQEVRVHAAGRRVELSWAGLAVLARSESEAATKLGGRPAGGYLVGDVTLLEEHLAAFAAAGAGHLIVTFPDSGTPGNYEALAPVAERLLYPPGV